VIEECLADLAYALRMGDAAAAEAVLSEGAELDSWESLEIARGRARADRELGRALALPPLAADPLPFIAEEARLSYLKKPPRKPRRRAAA
jgi:hypothetical protein